MYRSNSGIIGMPDNDADIQDFMDNHDAQCTEISDIAINETTAIVELSYTDFKTKVTDWTKVMDICTESPVVLILLSDIPL
jgi:hypothetical protein